MEDTIVLEREPVQNEDEINLTQEVPIDELSVPTSVPQAMPYPRPSAGWTSVQPNCSAAAVRTFRIFSSPKCLRRNSSGSMPAFTAMISICDSLANVFVLLAGARQAPVAKG